MAKILLVEDERNIASFIERGLHEFGHTVSVTHDAPPPGNYYSTKRSTC